MSTKIKTNSFIQACPPGGQDDSLISNWHFLERLSDHDSVSNSFVLISLSGI
jgi:hypothetical protein